MRAGHKALLSAMLMMAAPGCIDASDAASTEPDTAADEAPADRGMAFVDEDGDGVCDQYPRGRGRGRGYGRGEIVDEDGDGVCDHYAEGRGGGPGMGRGRGRRQFVDKDGDGVCDHYVERAAPQN